MVGRLTAMPDAPKRLEANYANAKRSLATSVREVERLSKQRFEQLVKLPASERIDQLTDPMLTSTDSYKLARSLQPIVPSRPIYRPPLSVRMSAVGRRLRLGRLLSPTPLFLLSIAVIYSGIVWHNTAHQVMISRPIDVTWRYPSGPVAQTLETRFSQQLLSVDGDRATIRLWVPRQGYVQIDVPSSIIVPPAGR
jgi:hypothetical protein